MMAARETDTAAPDSRGWIQKRTDEFGTAELTILGVTAYIMLRYSYWSFFNRFGVTLEEVGLGYANVLARSGPLLAFAILLPICISAMLARRVLGSHRLGTITLASAIAIVLIVFVAGPLRAKSLADAVERGRPIRPRAIGELLDLRVDHVTTAAPTQDPAAAPTQDPAAGQQSGKQVPDERPTTNEIVGRSTLLYFGQANGVAVLYDYERRQIIRVSITRMTILTE
jgi:hypothetical protein